MARWQASSRDLFRGSAVNGLDKNRPNSSSQRSFSIRSEKR